MSAENGNGKAVQIGKLEVYTRELGKGIAEIKDVLKNNTKEVVDFKLYFVEVITELKKDSESSKEENVAFKKKLEKEIMDRTDENKRLAKAYSFLGSLIAGLIFGLGFLIKWLMTWYIQKP